MTGAQPDQTAASQLRLRPNPKPAMRLSRKALIALGCTGAVTIGGALILALQPSHIKTNKANQPEYSVQNRPVADRFNGLPKDYTQTVPAPGEVPQLGAPLPGDLGKPMLDTQGKTVAEAVGANGQTISSGVTTSQPPATTASRSPTPEETVRDTARQSQLFTQTSRNTDPTGPATLPPIASQAFGAIGNLVTAPNPASATPASRQLAFLNQASDHLTTSPERLQSPASPYLIQAGDVIPAALISGLRSDLPGQVTAQVSQNVYDSLTGRYLLIPQGSRLIGKYDNAVAFGQSRILLAWTRLILPNGRSLILDKLSAADTQGLAGLSDHTDYHWAGMLQAAALSTLLSVGAEAGSSQQDSDIVRALRAGAADSISRTGQQVVERQLNIQPTLTIRPGFPVRVILTRDLVLEPYGD